jgi:hypothetical protein
MLLAWLGYSLAYYGFDQITSGNDSFVSLVWPGRYVVVARDPGSGSGGSSGSGITGTMVPPSTSTPSKSSSGSAGSKAAQKLF